MATTAIDLSSAKYKYRRNVGDGKAQTTTYGLEMSVGGQDYTFVPNSVVSKGLSSGGNQYVLPWFLNRDNLAKFGEIGIPVDAANFPETWISDYLKDKVNASSQGVLIPTGSLKFDSEVRTFEKGKGAVVGMGERNGQLVYLQDKGGVDDRYMTSDGNIQSITFAKSGGGLFDFFDDIVSGVSDIFSGIDDAVNEIPGGWGTVAAIGGGIALANAAAAAAPAAAGAGAGAGAASAGTGLTLGGGGLGLSAGGTGLGITAGSAGAGTIGAGLGTTLAGVTTGVAAGAGLLGSGAGLTTGGTGTGLTTTGSGTGLLSGSTGTGLTTGSSGLGLTTGGGLGLTTGSAGAGSIGAGLGEALAAIDTGIASGAATVGSLANSSGIAETISKLTGLSPETIKNFAPSAIQGLLSAGGSYLQSEQAKEAAQIQSDAQIRAAQIAADSARFRPVGVTTRFGSSNFQTDAAGNVIGAGYTASPEILGYQNRLSALAGQGLTDAEQARTAYAPLTGAAQSLFGLGQGYLSKTPEQAAQEYIAKQQALLTPSRENQLAELRNRQFQTGRGGAATAQGGNLMATSPEMAAYYNSIAQSDLVLAAQADEEARRRITYGAGLFDTGANLQGRYYTGQTAAYSPFTTAMDVTSGLENLAQTPLTLGTQIGAKTTASAAEAGRLTGQGIINAAGTMAPANAYSLGGNVLAGVAGSPNVTGALNRAFGVTAPPTQQQYTFNPATGQYVPVQQFVA